MQRIPDSPFVNGNPATSTQGTIVTADWLNAIQEELAGTIEGLGGVLDPGNNGQLLDRLLARFAPTSTFRNKIINGAMLVDQEFAGASTTFTAGLTGQPKYAIDQWYGFCAGANLTGQRIANPLLANTARYRFTGLAGNTGVGFGQRIEAINTAMLAGKTATLQAKLSSSSLSVITWTAYYATTKDVFGTLSAPSRTQIATGTFTINATESIYSANITIPGAVTTGIEIVFTGGALLAAQMLTFGDIQLEAGNNQTLFENVPYGIELLRCQRYSCKTYDDEVAVGSVASNNGAITYYNGQPGWVAYGLWPFPTTMRSAPTIKLYSTASGVVGKVRQMAGNIDKSATTRRIGSGCVSFYNSEDLTAADTLEAQIFATSRL